MKLSIAQRLYLGLSAGYVIVITVGILSYLSHQKYVRQAEWVKHTLEVLKVSSSLKQQMAKLETAKRNTLLTGESGFYDAFEAVRKEAILTSGLLPTLVSDNPSQLANARAIETEVHDIIGYWQSQPDTVALSLADLRQTIRKATAITIPFDEKIDAFILTEDRYLHDRNALNTQSRGQSLNMLLGGLLLILAIVSILSYQVYHELIGRVKSQRQLKQNLKEMEALIAETSLQNWQLSALSTFNNVLQVAYYGDVDELANACAKSVAGMLDVPSAVLYQYHESGHKLLPIGKFAPPSKLATYHTVGVGITGQAAESRDISVITDLPAGSLALEAGIGPIQPKALALVPLWADEQLIGLLELVSLRDFAPEQLRLLELLAHNMASALKRVAARKHLEELVDRISEQKEELESAQDVLTEQASALEQGSRYKSEFLANMSHELRTPLNSILILANLLSDDQDGRLTEKQREYSRIIHKSGADLLNLINDILDLSKIEAGKIDLLPENVPISALLADMEDLFRAVAAERQVRFEVTNVIAGNQAVFTDRKRVEQILKNLLSNALKFTPAGGEVSLTVQQDAIPEHLAFAVKDTGPGIAEEYQTAIFEAFKQVDGATNRKYGGTGLGLSISKRLSEQLGGSLTLTSALGVGSEFVLHLPASMPSVALPEKAVTRRRPIEASPAKAVALAREQRVVPDDRHFIAAQDRALLIIEDDENFATILRDFARRKDYLAIVALTGEEGLYCARKFKPSAILLDIHLPGLSGTEILATLKRTPDLSGIPVHIITSHDDLGHLAEEISGMTIKPFEIGELDAIFGSLVSTMPPEPVEKPARPLTESDGLPSARLDGATILLADDDMRNVYALTAMLETHGAEVVAATDGAEALEQLEANPAIQLILMDIMMPVMDGYQTMRKIRENPKWNHIPILAVSAKAMTGDREQAIAAGASDYLTKPIDRNKLMVLSNKWLTR